MTKEKIDMYLATNSKMFAPEKVGYITEKLSEIPDERYPILLSLQLRDPMVVILCAVLVGGLGIDRFLLEDMGMGLLKLLTGGCCGVLAIIDWFTAQERAREYNMKKFEAFIAG